MATSTGTGQFSVQNGQIIGPDGKVFIARGVNVMEGQLSQGAANVATQFPGINFVRLPIYDYADPAILKADIDKLTSQGIVVELENHDNGTSGEAGGGGGQIFTGAQLATEQN